MFPKTNPNAAGGDKIKKSELKTGLIVTTRAGEEYMVFMNVKTGYTGDGKYDVIVNIRDSDRWNNLDSYDEDLTYHGITSGRYAEWDIVKVEMYDHPCALLNKEEFPRTLLWERED